MAYKTPSGKKTANSLHGRTRFQGAYKTPKPIEMLKQAFQGRPVSYKRKAK